MNVVFTGPCDLFVRSVFEEWLEDHHIKMQKAITKKTDLLVTDFDPDGSRTSKLRKAKQLGIKIVTYKTFLHEYIPEFMI